MKPPPTGFSGIRGNIRVDVLRGCHEQTARMQLVHGGGRRRMDLDRKQIGALLKLREKYVVIDKAVYDSRYPNDLKMMKLLAKDDIEFASHIPDYRVYPDYAIGKIVNQGIRLLVCLLYPNLRDIPVGMIEHIKLRGLLYPDDHMNVLIKKWQDRSKIAKFEVGIENQRGILVYESTVYGTLIKKPA
jgi:3-hydroxymyristoyl/3-hydroxydecanoyl-(acyl carrier protein) dehydratase